MGLPQYLSGQRQVEDARRLYRSKYPSNASPKTPSDYSQIGASTSSEITPGMPGQKDASGSLIGPNVVGGFPVPYSLKSAVDASGKLLPQYSAQTGLSFFDKTAPNRWLDLQQKQAGLDLTKNLDASASQGMGAMGQVLSNLQMRGGLDSGAAERMGGQAAQQTALGQQGVRGQSQYEEMLRQQTAEQQRQGINAQNIGLSNAAASTDLQTQLGQLGGTNQYLQNIMTPFWQKVAEGGGAAPNTITPEGQSLTPGSGGYTSAPPNPLVPTNPSQLQPGPNGLNLFYNSRGELVDKNGTVFTV